MQRITDEDIRLFIESNPNLSFRKSAKEIRKNGYKVSNERVNKIHREIHNRELSEVKQKASKSRIKEPELITVNEIKSNSYKPVQFDLYMNLQQYDRKFNQDLKNLKKIKQPLFNFYMIGSYEYSDEDNFFMYGMQTLNEIKYNLKMLINNRGASTGSFVVYTSSKRKYLSINNFKDVGIL